MSRVAKKVLFRVDASARIGTGHVMRCLTLAQALRQRGAQCHFVCRRLEGHLGQAVQQAGFELHLLSAAQGQAGNGTGHAAWLEADAALDAEQTRRVRDTLGGMDWVVVDHYALDAAWEQCLRPAKILAIDDLADRTHDCDLLLDSGVPDAQRYTGRVPQASRLLLGPRYALLRDEFAAHRKPPVDLQSLHRPLRLFVSFGGLDPTDETTKTLAALNLLGTDSMEAEIVVGASNPRAQQLKKIAESMPRVHLHVAPANVAELMAGCHLALGAGGGMAWERSCIGLPSLILIVADNQRPLGQMLAERGLAYVLEATEVSIEDLAQTLRVFCGQPLMLAHMAARLRLEVDGRGASRVARVMLQPDIHLRRATMADRENLFIWRNAESVRRHSHDPAPIARAIHNQWFERTLMNPQRVLLIGECQGNPVGVLRYDLIGQQAKVSIYLVEGQAGHGYGPALLRAGSAWLEAAFSIKHEELAEIRPNNQASQAAFLDAGYVLDHYTYRL